MNTIRLVGDITFTYEEVLSFTWCSCPVQFSRIPQHYTRRSIANAVRIPPFIIPVSVCSWFIISKPIDIQIVTEPCQCNPEIIGETYSERNNVIAGQILDVSNISRINSPVSLICFFTKFDSSSDRILARRILF